MLTVLLQVPPRHPNHGTIRLGGQDDCHIRTVAWRLPNLWAVGPAAGLGELGELVYFLYFGVSCV